MQWLWNRKCFPRPPKKLNKNTRPFLVAFVILVLTDEYFGPQIRSWELYGRHNKSLGPKKQRCMFNLIFSHWKMEEKWSTAALSPSMRSEWEFERDSPSPAPKLLIFQETMAILSLFRVKQGCSDVIIIRKIVHGTASVSTSPELDNNRHTGHLQVKFQWAILQSVLLTLPFVICCLNGRICLSKRPCMVVVVTKHFCLSYYIVTNVPIWGVSSEKDIIR